MKDMRKDMNGMQGVMNGMQKEITKLTHKCNGIEKVQNDIKGD